MAIDKRYTDLPVAPAIEADNIMALVDPDGNISYQFTFAQLMIFLSSNFAIGANVTYGTSNPASGTGNNGDIFINTVTNQFLQKASGTWSTIYTVTPGIAGNQFFIASGAPSSGIGVLNDVYLDTATGIIYKKLGGTPTWTPQYSIATGPAGPRGASILNGTVDPINTDGLNGDFWINTGTNKLFGPKATGTWPTSFITLVPRVPNTLLNGPGNPLNSLGNNGDFYLNTVSFNWFGPKASDVWPSGIQLGGGGTGALSITVPFTAVTNLAINWQTDIPAGQSVAYVFLLGNAIPKPVVDSVPVSGSPNSYERIPANISYTTDGAGNLLTVTIDWSISQTGVIIF